MLGLRVSIMACCCFTGWLMVQIFYAVSGVYLKFCHCCQSAERKTMF